MGASTHTYFGSKEEDLQIVIAEQDSKLVAMSFSIVKILQLPGRSMELKGA